MHGSAGFRFLGSRTLANGSAFRYNRDVQGYGLLASWLDAALIWRHMSMGTGDHVSMQPSVTQKLWLEDVTGAVTCWLRS